MCRRPIQYLFKSCFVVAPISLPRLGIDILVDQTTGLLRTDRGIFLCSDPGRLVRFGSVYQVEFTPPGLKVEQRGRDAQHFELMPDEPMTLARYVELLTQVVLRPITDVS